MIPREEYITKLEAFRNKQIIKVVTGLRRSGKTTLMELYEDKLRKVGVLEEQIIHINFEDVDYDYIETYKDLHSEVVKRLVPDRMNYIILDEVQRVEGTGSNSKLLSGDLATLLSGRYVEINVLPLSFKEFAATKDGNTPLAILYQDYVDNGSFPFVAQLNEQWAIKQYLEGIYDSVVLKDIISRRKSIDASVLNRIIKFLFSNVGSECSANKIAGVLTSAGRKIAPQTVDQYLEAVVESFIFYKADRYDIKGKDLLKTNPKYYATDPGLRKVIIGSSSSDAGHILENVVYLELLRRGCRVYVGKIGPAEVDFVAVSDEGEEYYQVAYTVKDADGKTLERELRPLLSIRDHNPKYLLTMDYGAVVNHNGIRQINVLDWLVKA